MDKSVFHKKKQCVKWIKYSNDLLFDINNIDSFNKQKAIAN